MYVLSITIVCFGLLIGEPYKIVSLTLAYMYGACMESDDNNDAAAAIVRVVVINDNITMIIDDDGGGGGGGWMDGWMDGMLWQTTLSRQRVSEHSKE